MMMFVGEEDGSSTTCRWGFKQTHVRKGTLEFVDEW